jgi:hypothetical protein
MRAYYGFLNIINLLSGPPVTGFYKFCEGGVSCCQACTIALRRFRALCNSAKLWRSCAPSSYRKQVNNGYGSLSTALRGHTHTDPSASPSRSPTHSYSARSACSSSSNSCRTSKTPRKLASSSSIVDTELAQGLWGPPLQAASRSS